MRNRYDIEQTQRGLRILDLFSRGLRDDATNANSDTSHCDCSAYTGEHRCTDGDFYGTAYAHFNSTSDGYACAH